MSVTSATSTAATSSTVSNMVNNPKSVLGKDAFLQMLVTKLKYQDPLNPMTDDNFSSTMAQYSTVEQLTNLNSTFGTSIDALNKNMVSLLLMQNTSQAAAIIGKNVTIDNNGVTVTGTVDTVKFVDGQPKLMVNGNEYGLETVTEIKA